MIAADREPTAAGAGPRKRRRWPALRTPSVPIALALVVATTVLLSVTVGFVLFAGYRTARLNTGELVRERSEYLIRSVVERTRAHLDPVRAQLEFLADLIERERLGIAQPEKLGDRLLASLAAVPQETVVAFATPELQVMRAFRSRPGTPVMISDWRDDPGFERAMARASEAPEAYWGELYVAAGREMPFINLFAPVRIDGKFVGALIAGVAIEELSDFLASLGGSQLANPFILYGPDAVLAHPALRNGFHGLSDQHPLPTLAELGDPVLQRVWSEDPRHRLDQNKDFTNNSVELRLVDLKDQTFVFILQELPGYGGLPWTIGTYRPLDEAVPQLDRLTHLLWVGGIVLLLGLGLALWLGRSLSRPVRNWRQRRIGCVN